MLGKDCRRPFASLRETEMTNYTETGSFTLQLGAEYDTLDLSGVGAIDIITGSTTGLGHVHINSTADFLRYYGGTLELAHIVASGLDDNVDLGTQAGSSVIETDRPQSDIEGTTTLEYGGSNQTLALEGSATGDPCPQRKVQLQIAPTIIGNRLLCGDVSVDGRLEVGDPSTLGASFWHGRSPDQR
jgi:hypothetical protein